MENHGAANSDEVKRKVAKLYEDVYEGRGKENPPLVTRLSVLEESVDKINSNLSKMVWLLLSILGAAVGNIALHIAGK